MVCPPFLALTMPIILLSYLPWERVRRALKLAKREANKEPAEELLPKDDPAAAARMRRQQTNKKKAMQARATPGSPTPFSLCELPL